MSAAQPLRVLSLFAGIGGFDLGLERTGGFKTVAFCEIDPFCRRVLAKHWPEVPCYEDVRDLTAERLAADGIAVDVICGGFPCQDISTSGLGAGIEGERSGLWADFARLIGEIRPQFTIVENVSALLNNGMERVLGDLATIGCDADWHCIPASALGAPHGRDRVWIVAYPDCQRGRGGDTGRQYAKNARQPSRYPWDDARGMGHWDAEPKVGRVANGVPSRVDRLRTLGNAVVPQIPELIGRAILASMAV